MKTICPVLFSFFVAFSFAQSTEFKNYEYKWDTPFPEIDKSNSDFSDEDLVIINEKVSFNCAGEVENVLEKRCLLKINTDERAKQISNINLPESFNQSPENFHFLQGEKSGFPLVYIEEYKLVYFSARILKATGGIRELPYSVKSRKFYWVKSDGSHADDYCYSFSFANIEQGDIIEYDYKMEYRGNYGFEVFYFNNSIAKQKEIFEMKYAVPDKSIAYLHKDLICDLSGADSSFSENIKVVNNKRIITATYNLKNLKRINYPVNSCVGLNLPHIAANLSDSRIVYYDEHTHLVRKVAPFAWDFVRDTINKAVTVYDKNGAQLRKYLSRFKEINADNDLSSFLRTVCDSINSLKFVSAESLNYSENAQYAVSSAERLNKGKLTEEFISNIYLEILNEKKIPFNVLSVYDKRLSGIKTDVRAEHECEARIACIPNGKSLIYVMPRFGGLKYNSDELPFYYEGAGGALVYNNYGKTVVEQKGSERPIKTNLHFIKTPNSSENENVRAENAMIKINTDSLLMHLTIKENLNGQFSTICRPAYLKEVVDSTVNPVYFKKCVDKPNANNKTILKTYSSNVFPFKNSFACSENITIQNPTEIPLKNWFSFTYNKGIVPEKPNLDYYFDFQYSDTYNYMIEFNKPKTIANIDDFTKSITNTYFDLTSKITKQSETTYVLTVMVKVKESILPKESGQQLVDFVKELDTLNNLSLKLN